MSAILVEVYDALRDAGASEEKSRAAAKAIADYDTRFHNVEAELLVIKWMLGTVLAGVSATVLKLYL